ncbi:MAG: nucleoside hydrolase [Armatimonadota bacterium]
MTPQSERIPILLDTDIGTDIDDAVCLAYLLRQPRCELLGITTVTGEAKERAMLADALCRADGRDDIPIHSGAEQALLVPQQQSRAQQAEILSQFPHRTDFPPNTATEFLRQTIRSRPGEITLLTIGLLTNIGLLFALDPEIPGMLKSLVLMSGLFDQGIPYPSAREWNTQGDPHASAVVYNAKVATHLSIGLDVTLRCRLDAAICRKKFHGGPLDVVAKMAEVWFRGSGQITFHDPLAAAVIFQPDLCRYQDGKADIELLSRQVPGMVHWNPNVEEKPHRIAVDVDPDAFFAHYFATVRV